MYILKESNDSISICNVYNTIYYNIHKTYYIIYNTTYYNMLYDIL